MARTTDKTLDAADKKLTLPPHLSWRRMHPLTPLITGWKGLAAVLAFITYQNLDDAIRVYEAVRDSDFDVTDTEFLAAIAVTVIALLLIIAVLLLSWYYRAFAIDRDAVYLRSGMLDKQTRIARLPRIQSINVVYPLLGRIFGLGQLVVEVAGGSDSHVIIGYLRDRDLEAVRSQILSLAAGLDASALQEESDSPDSTDHSEPGGDREPAASAMPRGFEDAHSAPRLQRSHTEQEIPLYTVDTRVLIASIVRSIIAWVFAIMTIVIVVWIVAYFALGLDDGGKAKSTADFIAAFMPLFVLPFALGGVVWSKLNGGWQFRAAATPNGIRVQRGLTSAYSSTLPPGRIHAVVMRQGPLWHSKDWWEVKVTQAGKSAGEKSGTDSKEDDTLLPVGERDTALRALWLVVPDLGVSQPDAVLDAALSGMDDDGVGDPNAAIGSQERGFVRISRRGRIFSPLGWRREAIMLTDTCIIIRTGRWWRSVTVIPYPRIQSSRIIQGPLARRRDLAALSFDLVESTSGTTLSNLVSSQAAAVHAVVAERALKRASAEKLDRWLARAGQQETSFETRCENIEP